MKQTTGIFENFIQFFDRHPLPPQHHLLLAVSGGIDSVVLSHLCRQAGLRFSIAHCNFNLRGEASLADENFVKNLAGTLNVPVFTRQFETEKISTELKLSIQETARKVRYEWFTQLQETEGFDYVFTAHHADDSIETMMMHFFRGTGLRGLTGIPEINGKILRPLIRIHRRDIMAYAIEKNLGWVEDQSNSSSKYTRNFFRNELIPLIAKNFPNVKENLEQNLERFQHTYSFYEEQVAKELKELVERSGETAKIPVRKLKKKHAAILLYELTRPYGFSPGQHADILRLMDAATGRFVESGSHQLIRHGLWLVLAPRSVDAGMIAISENENEIQFSRGILQVKKGNIAEFSIENNPAAALLDAREIEYPLVLRKWKQGDYFYPLGMRKKKKLARFLIDQKTPKHEKENTWVIESGKKIIWVVGHRIDDRFKILPSTSSVLSITYQH